MDAVPSVGIPGSSEELARQQVLDEYDMSGGILNNIMASFYKGNGGHPAEMSRDMCRAVNDWHREHWLEADPRWRASINTAFEIPEMAAEEIRRCRSLSDRYVQVLLERRQDYPAGHRKYWPIYAACVEADIPVGFHVGGNKRITACGQPNYYFEEHCDFALSNFNCVSSFIFEGVFDEFPTLKVALIEENWAWSVPYAWRLDAAYRKLKAEVKHLKRLPSDYVREHFYYTTQPMEEPEQMEETIPLFKLMVDHGMDDKLMFSSDYPHWDFDAPTDSVPEAFPTEWRRKILGENAAALYGVPLRENSGVRSAAAVA